jgi:rod shape-determining protein MreD
MTMPIIAALLAVLLEVSFFGHVRPFGVMPNLMIIVITISAMWSQATPTLVAALLGGLLLDGASGTDFGLRTAFFAALALAVIAARQLGLHTDSIITTLAIVAVATVLFNLVVLTSVMGVSINSGFIISQIGREVVLNSIFTVAIWLAGINIRQRQLAVVERARGSWL